MQNLFTSSKELFNHLVVMCERKKKSFDCIWDIIGDDIIDIIPKSKSYILRDSKEGFEYLGNYYVVEEVKDVNI